MTRTLLIAVRTAVVTLVLTGILYPFLITGMARVLFPQKAEGSWVTDDRGLVVGSELIAQGFHSPAYLQPRLSAAGDKGYDGLASSGSNLGTTSRKLQERMEADAVRLHRENPEAADLLPDDLMTASGSGLDPDISPEAARWQAPRIARARRVAVERVQRLVDSSVRGATLGVLGEARVNVLLFNLALDRQFGRPGVTPSVGG